MDATARPDLHVYFLVLHQTHALDLSGPVQAIGALNELGIARVALSYVGAESRVTLHEGLVIDQIEPLPPDLAAPAVVFVPGVKWSDELYSQTSSHRAKAWLAGVAAVAAEEVVGICTGAFLLAEAGLLKGRRCTTHHAFLAALADRYPQARVLEDRLFLRDGNITTSAGVSSGIDTTVDLIRRRFGDAAAALVSQELAMYVRRTAMDPQYSDLLAHRNHLNPAVHRAQNLLLAQPAEPWRVEGLARAVNLSARQLSRLFRRHTGVSIKAYQLTVRLERARALLAHTELPVERIAREAGFDYPQNFRREWRRRFGQSPSQWRRSSPT